MPSQTGRFTVVPRADPLPSSARAAVMTHPEFPLQLRAWSLTEAPQEDFGRKAAAALDGLFPDIIPVASVIGLFVLARNEPALAGPVKRLLNRFGHEQVRLTEPQARHWPGSPPRWPVMTVQVRVPRLYASRVGFNLLDRGAPSIKVEHGPLASVVGAQLAQTSLMGYASWLEQVTSGLFDLSIELSHYAPIGDDDPGPRAA